MKTIYFLMLLSFFSCQKELSKAERYENETYQLLNEGYRSIKYMNSYIIDKPINLLKINRFGIREIDDKLKLEYHITSNDSLYLKKWNKSKLENIKTLDSELFIFLFKNSVEIDSMCNLGLIDEAKLLFKKQQSLWNKKITKSVIYLTYPKFNTDFTKALLFYDARTDPNKNYGCFVNNTLLFKKENGKWIIDDANYQIINNSK